MLEGNLLTIYMSENMIKNKYESIYSFKLFALRHDFYTLISNRL
jgi:hypothetical protein